MQSGSTFLMSTVSVFLYEIWNDTRGTYEPAPIKEYRTLESIRSNVKRRVIESSRMDVDARQIDADGRHIGPTLE